MPLAQLLCTTENECMAEAKKAKKPKPYQGLTPHPRGQWVKRINGKLYWFGPLRDPEAAHKNYLAVAKELHAGTTEITSTRRATVLGIGDKFLTWIKGAKLTDAWKAAYARHVGRFMKHAGPKLEVCDLQPDHFASFLVKYPKGRDKAVQCIRTWFHHAEQEGWIDPVRFGKSFKKTPAAERRARKRQRLFTPLECRTILAHAEHPLRAMILLALNSGMGQTDIATLTVGDVQGAIIDMYRHKTGIKRRFPLWRKTRRAIRQHLKDKSPTDLVFVTRHGKPWVREQQSQKRAGKITTVDSVAQEFGKILVAAGIWQKNDQGRAISDGRNFYTLRRTFRTIADDQGDQRAIALVMGHAVTDMGGVYVQRISDARLSGVVDHVFRVIYPRKAPSPLLPRP